MIIDAVILAVLVVSALIAFFRGFVREILTIFGMGGGLIAAFFGGPFLAPLMKDWLVSAEGPQKLFDVIPFSLIAYGLSYGLIFIVVVVLLSLLSSFLSEAVKSIGLGAIDRSLGVIFGLVRGAVLLSLLYMPVYLFVDQAERDGWFKGSVSYFYLEASTGFLSKFLPGDTADSTSGSAGEGQKNGARKTLEKLDLLKKSEKSGEGYNKDFRNRMNDLFKAVPAGERDFNE